MKPIHHKRLAVALCFLSAFVLWTLAVRAVDVKAIGPLNSSVGFAAMNGYFHRLTGVHLSVYLLTDWLSLIPLALVLCFALLGLWQWIRRKSLLRVDGSLLALGGFYLIVMAAYVFFEVFVVNFRPVLINGALEASYPSSTTVLVLCVMSTSAMQLRSRIKRQALRRAAVLLIAAFSFFMIASRMLCGVHWLSDIIGGVLLSAALVMLYAATPFAR